MTLDTPKADKWTSLVLFALGVAMLVGGYTMDRLEIRHIHPASIPGLVPMILGASMMLCSALLFRSAYQQTNDQTKASEEAQRSGDSTASVTNLVFAALYSVVFAIFLVGSMPFALASTLYIAVFYLHFTWKEGIGNAEAPMAKRAFHLAFSIAFAAGAGYAIASLFQYGFLVRLP